MPPSSTLTISTYNWPQALELTLLTVKRQHLLPDEVVIADDGSGEETRSLIDHYRKNFPVPLHHVWQPDEGFRLAAIRNKAIAKASGDYIIQVDGDMLLHPDFIRDHISFAQSGTFVRASRIYINEAYTEECLREKKAPAHWWQKGLSNRTSAFRFPLAWPLFETRYKNKGLERYEIHGCNMAFWKQDAVEVNGYNEAFEGWGIEDKEFVARMLNAGKTKRFIKLGAIAWHLWHPENSKSRLDHNQSILDKAIADGTKYCARGLGQYLGTP